MCFNLIIPVHKKANNSSIPIILPGINITDLINPEIQLPTNKKA